MGAVQQPRPALQHRLEQRVALILERASTTDRDLGERGVGTKRLRGLGHELLHLDTAHLERSLRRAEIHEVRVCRNTRG